MIDRAALVAVSVSAPDQSELAALGLSDLHVRFVFTELVRHVLAAGGRVAYGGRLDDAGADQPNFTKIMLDMVAGYRPDLRPDSQRLVNFAAAALWSPDRTKRSKKFDKLVEPYQGRFTVEYCSAEPRQGVPPGAEDLWGALSFTAMREQMAEECAARVIVGGRLSGYAGRYPGVIEEAILTAQAKKALFVVGGFGGCGAALARHLAGEEVAELTQEWQTAHTAPVAAMAKALSGSPYRLDLEADLGNVLPRGSWDSLHNGLSDHDNERLAVTTDPDEVAALVLRGLHAVAPGPNQAPR